MYLNVFGNQIPLYGIFFYIGVFLAGIVGVLISKRRNIPKFDIVCSGIYTMIGAVIGAKLLFLAVSWRDILEYMTAYNIPISDIIMSVIKGGFVFYGGLIGGLLGLAVYSCQFKMKFSDFLDIYAVVLPLGHAFGRIGCFFGGCCYGIPYDGMLSHTYEYSAGTTPLGVPLLPIQLIEAFLLFLLFVGLMCVFLFFDKKQLCVKLYSICYGVIRFVLEFFRGDTERGGWGLLSTSQWISVAIICITIGEIVFERLRYSRDMNKKAGQ